MKGILISLQGVNYQHIRNQKEKQYLVLAYGTLILLMGVEINKKFPRISI